MKKPKLDYEFFLDVDTKRQLSNLALTLNTPEKVDLVRLLLRFVDTPLAGSSTQMLARVNKESDRNSIIMAMTALDDVKCQIAELLKMDVDKAITLDMRKALDCYVICLGTPHSALLASEIVLSTIYSTSPWTTHNMSITDEFLAENLHCALRQLEVAIVAVMEKAKEVAK